MQLTSEQLKQLTATLVMARSGFRQCAIAMSDVRALEARTHGKKASEEDVERYVEYVSRPFIEPIEAALATLESQHG